jgi:hypothetical protein
VRPLTVQGTEELIDDAIGDAGRVLTSARREGIEFVKEDDARRTAARTLEEVAHRRLGGANVPDEGGNHTSRGNQRGDRLTC